MAEVAGRDGGSFQLQADLHEVPPCVVQHGAIGRAETGVDVVEDGTDGGGSGFDASFAGDDGARLG